MDLTTDLTQMPPDIQQVRANITALEEKSRLSGKMAAPFSTPFEEFGFAESVGDGTVQFAMWTMVWPGVTIVMWRFPGGSLVITRLNLDQQELSFLEKLRRTL